MGRRTGEEGARVVRLEDAGRFRRAMERMHRLHGLPLPTDDDVRDWSTELRDFPIEVIETGLDEARRKAAEWRPKASVAREACQAQIAARRASVTSGRTRFVPQYTDDEGRTVFSAEYSCPLCEDGGWEPVRYDETGQTRLGLMTMSELRSEEARGRVHYRMRRCDCRRRTA